MSSMLVQDGKIINTADPRQLLAAKISFKRYLTYLQEASHDHNILKRLLYSFVIKRFNEEPRLLETFDHANEVEAYSEVLELVRSTLFPLIEEAGKSIFALSMPLSVEMFYLSDDLKKFITDKETGKIKIPEEAVEDPALQQNRLIFVYKFLLEKLYGFDLNFNYELIISKKDPVSGLFKYYRLHNDARFIDVLYDTPLPDISPEIIYQSVNYVFDVELLQKILPLSMFRLEGFSIIRMEDVTGEHAIDIIKNAIVKMSDYDNDEMFQIIERALRTLLGHNELSIGILPLFKVNGENVLAKNKNERSILVRKGTEAGVAEKCYLDLGKEYLQKIQPFIIPLINDEVIIKYPFLEVLRRTNIKGYLLLPMFDNGKAAGVLEIATYKEDVFNDMTIATLEPAIPLLSQILHNKIEQFNNDIIRVIKEQFTTIQPAVEWKFNDVAWKYLKDIEDGKHDVEMRPVTFKDVYPFYGAIDIRNSTIERNHALQNDLQKHFDLLLILLNQLKGITDSKELDNVTLKSYKYLDRISEYVNADDENHFTEFLTGTVVRLLTEFKEKNSSASSLINDYFLQTAPKTGVVDTNRRALEKSIKLINTTLSDFYDIQRKELQSIFPCYFEKFRSDGIEYNMYVGQSISPSVLFKKEDLTKIKKWQLCSMASAAKLTYELIAKMPKHLHTTQLILLNALPIDISFRKDEKKFDVEGAYNIRYEIIKKRIDKVHISGTNERLTQPDKIAIVYSNNKEAELYVGFIKELQQEHILNNDLEHLELEELQGIAGLKALRVGVNLQ